ncbi:DedA family protein [Aliikangiella marina]|uniref:DedA family protein n=1 Tax=Aliikangiella marina TaxID=1712262 RepID=A0A545TC64_9GAMM|nr:DedA family protein [Aliikangiella marina]TQV74781.1 DedA family protein [Aliikangiella marina]
MNESILTFIEQNAQWAALIIFIIAFMESVAIVGLLIPGWLLLVGVGTLVGADVLDFYSVVIAAYLGAVIGEYLSFLVGYHYHEKVLRWRFVAKHQKIIDKSHEFFAKHGISGVFLGRFFGPTRAVVPLLAGISEMPQKTFFWVNIISGIIWAPVYLTPGILVGAAVTLDDDARNFLLFVIGMITIFSIVAWNYSQSLVKQIRENKTEVVTAMKAGLAWAIVLTIVIVLINSNYWPLVGQIVDVVISRF